jgi:hypothetical protein
LRGGFRTASVGVQDHFEATTALLSELPG